MPNKPDARDSLTPRLIRDVIPQEQKISFHSHFGTIFSNFLISIVFVLSRSILPRFQSLKSETNHSDGHKPSFSILLEK
jgi:hypothetical protein